MKIRPVLVMRNIFPGSIIDAIGSVDDLIEKNKGIVEESMLGARLEYEKSVSNPSLVSFVPFESILAACTTGLNPRKNFKLGEGECFYVTIKNMDGVNVILDDRCDRITKDAVVRIQQRSKIRSGCTLFSGIGTIGRTYLCKEEPMNWNISESVFCFAPRANIPPEFVFESVNSTEFQEFANVNASGAAQKGIRMADLKAHLIPLPCPDVLEEFKKSAKPLLDTAFTKQKEIEKLLKIRAILLNKYF